MSYVKDGFDMAEQGEPVFRGDRERGWIDIADLAEAYRLVIDADARAVESKIFHLADELRPRSLDVVRARIGAAGYGGEIRVEAPAHGDNITRFSQNEFIASQKAREWLGWGPRHMGIMESARGVHEAWKAARSIAAN